jgi:DTW domain-containing protein YfiP
MVMHDREIALAVDTAKLAFLAFPSRARGVVGGLRLQPHAEAMRASLERGDACVLYPTEEAMTADELVALHPDKKWDVVVLDGTWKQVCV